MHAEYSRIAPQMLDKLWHMGIKIVQWSRAVAAKTTSRGTGPTNKQWRESHRLDSCQANFCLYSNSGAVYFFFSK